MANVYVNYRIAFLAAVGVAYDDLLIWAQENIDCLKKREQDLNEIENERLLIFGLFKEKLINDSTSSFFSFLIE